MNPVHIGIIGIVVLIAILFSKFPVAFCMALVGLLGFGYLVSPDAALSIAMQDFYSAFSSYNMTVVPLFVFMGQILFYSGISQKLFDAASAWFGHYKGGLAMATIGACAGFSAICGSTNATAARREALKGWRLADVIKFSNQNHGSAFTAAFFVAMNKDKWNSLPPDIQKTIEAVNSEWIPKSAAVWDKIDEGGTEATLAKGNKIITYSPEETDRWAKAVRPLLDEYVKDAGSKNLPGDAVLKFALERVKQL